MKFSALKTTQYWVSRLVVCLRLQVKFIKSLCPLQARMSVRLDFEVCLKQEWIHTRSWYGRQYMECTCYHHSSDWESNRKETRATFLLAFFLCYQREDGCILFMSAFPLWFLLNKLMYRAKGKERTSPIISFYEQKGYIWNFSIYFNMCFIFFFRLLENICIC